MTAMTESEFRAVLQSEIEASLGYLGDELSEARANALARYFGRPYGDVGDADGQREVLRAALALASSATEPGQVEHLPFRWPEDPKETKWHPAEPSPIIAFIKDRQARKKG